MRVELSENGKYASVYGPPGFPWVLLMDEPNGGVEFGDHPELLPAYLDARRQLDERKQKEEDEKAWDLGLSPSLALSQATKGWVVQEIRRAFERHAEGKL